MNKDTIARVRHDLRCLRRLRVHIASKQRLERYHKAQIEYLRVISEAKNKEELIKSSEDILSHLNISQDIERANKKEQKYQDAINELEPTYQAIIRRAYILGESYEKIGLDIGYSDRQVKRLSNEAIIQLAEILEESDTNGSN